MVMIVSSLYAGNNGVVCQNLRLVCHAVRFRDFPDHPAGVAGGERIGGNIPGDYTSRADDHIIADGDAGTDHHVGTKPAVVAHGDGLGVAHPLHFALAVQHGNPLIGEQGMDGGDDGDVGTEVTVIADGHRSVVLDGQVEIAEEPVTNGGMYAVMEGDGTLEEAVFSKFSNNFANNLRPLFRFVLVGQNSCPAKIFCSSVMGNPSIFRFDFILPQRKTPVNKWKMARIIHAPDVLINSGLPYG